MKSRPFIFIFIFIFISDSFSGLQASELPKDLRVAEEMIRDGLAHDAVARIRGWLQKNSSSPQPEAQVLWPKRFWLMAGLRRLWLPCPKLRPPTWSIASYWFAPPL